MTVTLERAVAAVREHRASLVAESAGYLVLAAADQIQSAPRIVGAEEVLLTPEGSLRLSGGLVATGGEAVLALRALLGSLLSAARGGTASLSRVAAASDGGSDVNSFVLELEAALIPVNRAAARRALSRLCRETVRALPALTAPAAVPQRAPAPRVSPALAGWVPAVVAASASAVAHREPGSSETGELEIPVEVSFEPSSPGHAVPVAIESETVPLTLPAPPPTLPPSLPPATPLFGSPVMAIEPMVDIELIPEVEAELLSELDLAPAPLPLPGVPAAPEATQRLDAGAYPLAVATVPSEPPPSAERCATRPSEPRYAMPPPAAVFHAGPPVTALYAERESVGGSPPLPRGADVAPADPSPARAVSDVADLLQRFVDNLERSDNDVRRELKTIAGIDETTSPPRVASPPGAAVQS